MAALAGITLEAHHCTTQQPACRSIQFFSSSYPSQPSDLNRFGQNYDRSSCNVAVELCLNDREDGDCKASGDKQRPRPKRTSPLQSRESADPLPYAAWTVRDQEPGAGRLPYRMLRYLVMMQLQLQLQLHFSAQDSCHAHFIPEPAWSQPARSCIVE